MTRRAGAALIGLIAVLLAVVPGAVPAWAGSLARTMPGAYFPGEPGPVTNLNATVVSGSEIDLTWTQPSDGTPPSGYDVFDSTTQGQEQSNTSVNDQPVQDTSYQVTGLNSCQTYYFEVDSVDSGGNDVVPSSPDEVSAETSCTTPLPAAAIATAAPSGSSGGPWAAILPLIFVGAGIGALIAWWRRRKGRRRRRTAPQDAPTPQTAPASSVHAVAHAGPPGVVVIRPTGTDATLTVRVESHKAPSITTIEEVPPR